ncbi:bifunctional hydroxymethylpyrimidine kinase/phosphomethylpyrimidine kinase [Leucobacter albus]|uniref:Bifunctional hydroxymethylpyrimidine kinase/phosphomethylpyrimidine kinase n=1 Tax=Leucobacter albus TaxID=272210 RepID=A0ABW3TP34_9MICO
MTAPFTPNILSIAGTDPTGGAGIQADLKSIAAGGGYGMAVVTALVAQNTRGVREVHVPDTAFLRAQLDAVSDDVRIDAVKIGMLANTEVIETVADWLGAVRGATAQPSFPVVLDPVMIAASGDPLLAPETIEALRRLIPLADLVTPNLFELAELTGEAVAADWAAALAQGRRLAEATGVRVLVKGGHLPGESAPDALVAPGGEVTEFAGSRIHTPHTHGTGCSLSAGVATRIARRPGDWAAAVGEAKAWLRESLAAAGELSVGGGSGPLNHLAGLWLRGGLETRPTAEAVRETWWAGIATVREQTEQLGFIRGLADGTLERAHFLEYIAQDSVYLHAYARVLARVSEIAPSPEEQAFWARAAHGAIMGELELHRARLGDDAPIHVASAAPSAATSGYVNHLLAASTKDYAEAAAAVLPCFWVYADLGKRLVSGAIHARAQQADHPYAEWIATYDDAGFAADNETAIGYVTAAAAAADAATRERMWRAFEVGAIWEREFFGQTPAG